MLALRRAVTSRVAVGVFSQSPATQIPYVVAARPLSTAFHEKEKAEEAVYFKKEEKELLKKLSKKLGLPGKEIVDQEKVDVKAILAKHHVTASDQCVSEILEYFHSS